ncbi:ras and EF-hand domain-containing protein isoform X1 [Hydra vulgaris]|nr:ras and EF-hand domain-containing protein-like isoform X2 [Hydra vulgaris]XP_047141663.1 ras and EF-hand domain-containing protein-like isoform X2 [Hydra vulgaris]
MSIHSFEEEEQEEQEEQEGFLNDYFDNNANNNTSRKFEHRMFSCASCILFDSKNPIIVTETDGFPIRRVASCSVCCWDFDDNVLCVPDIQRNLSSDSRATSSSSEDSFITSNSKLKECSFISDFKSFEKKEKEKTLNSKSSSDISDLTFSLPPLRRTDSYNSAINITENDSLKNDFKNDFRKKENRASHRKSKHKRNFIEKAFRRNKHRTPPDGTEVSCVVVDDHLKSNNFDSSENCKTSDCEIRQPTISINATKELDEIFGKITKVSELKTKEEEENDYFSCSDQENSDNEKNKKQISLLKRLSPNRSFKKLPRSRSLNNLSKNCLPSSGFIRTQSSMDLSTVMDYDFMYDGLEAKESENWNSFLKKISDISLFEKNFSLRHLWQKLVSHQDLTSLFEDSLRCIVEDMEKVHKKYEGLETLFASKLEQEEKEKAKIYDDVEIVIQQERQCAHEKIIYMETQLRSEHQSAIESRDLEIQNILRLNNDLSLKNTKYKEEYELLKSTLQLMEQQVNQCLKSEEELRNENAILIQEKIFLIQKAEQTEEIVKNLKESVALMQKDVENEKNKNKTLLRQHNDMLEEKMHLDSKIDTLTAAFTNLKKQNDYLITSLHVKCPTAEIFNVHNLNNKNYEFDEFTKQDVISTLQSSYLLKNKAKFSNEDAQKKLFSKAKTYKINKLDINNKNVYSPLPIKKVLNTDDWPLSPPKLTDENNSSQNELHKSELLSSFDSHHPTESYIRSSFKNKISKQLSYKSNEFNTKSFTNGCLAKTSSLRFAECEKNTYKIIFIGDSNVGKTSFIRRVCFGKFRASREETRVSDFSTICVNSEGKNITLNLWDTLGQERFNSIPPSYFRRSDIVVLMYDVTEDTSFFSVKNWIRKIHDLTDENVFLMIIANKIDLDEKISCEKGRELAKDHDAIFIETSAKTGENIDLFCQMVLSTLIDREDTALIRKDFTHSLCNLSYSKRSQTTCCS